MKVFRRIGALTLIAFVGTALTGIAAQASAAAFTPAPGVYTVNTSVPNLVGPSTSIPGTVENGIAVFSFDSINIPAGVVIEAEGSRPFELKAAGAFTLAGLIEASGFDATANTAGPNAGGPGGGAGGANGGQAGLGPGGGGTGVLSTDGGGGGGFGGAGAAGGVLESQVGFGTGPGGAAYGNLNALLQGGSGGAGGTIGASAVGGGGGGGAVELAASSLTIVPGGEVFADGGNGSGGNQGASGGGSGGGILLHADTINVAGLLSAQGGQGGTGGCCGDGGGGGGGRIAYQFKALVNAGTALVGGGASGKSGPFPSSHPSPNPTGAPGVITNAQAATAVTSPATGRSSTGAKLNGTVNPNGSATTYRFEYGKTTAYGTSVPVPNAAAGSDSAAHAFSLKISKLKPKSTYHYRIVAVDGLGFTSAGADVAFKTKPFTGVKIGKKAKIKKGVVRVKLSSKTACKGRLKLTTKVKGAKGKGKTIKLGSASFSLPAGKARTVKVPLTGAAISLLEAGGSLKAKASVKAKVAGVSKTTKRTLKLGPVSTH